MTEQSAEEQKPRNAKTWHVVGYAEISPSGRSLRLTINNAQDTIFDRTYYIGLESLQKVLGKHKKTATIYILEEEG